MAAAHTSKPGPSQEAQDREVLKGVIRGGVLRALGESGWPGRVQVRPLWDDFYRVNLFIGDGPGCEKIVSSYFLKADGAGNILQSCPGLSRPGQAAGKATTS